jgi:hypothetical protein
MGGHSGALSEKQIQALHKDKSGAKDQKKDLEFNQENQKLMIKAM